MCAANFSVGFTSSPSSGWSSSGSNRTPSGARSISIPDSVTVASPETSMSSMRFGAAPAPEAENDSGSKPRRSVKRHASSEVDGSGMAR